MHITQKESCEKIDTGHGEYIYKLTDPKQCGLTKHDVVYVEIEPGKSSRKHYHPVVEETYFILSGHAEIVIDNEKATLLPQQLVVIPTGSTHKITNLSKTDMLCFLVSCATSWHKDCSVFLEDN